MTAYYNEYDKFAAQWLRELIKAGHIAPGYVDERSIEDVTANDLNGFTQCHFFAGIGVWSYALRQAGWPDNRPVWTGSCPCQPFSSAGKRAGLADERHLWPAWYHLIGQHKPTVVFGEQVASQDGLGWLDLVQTDLEAAGYAFGANDLCAAGFGAPHIRQRLFFIAEGLGNSNSSRTTAWVSESQERKKRHSEIHDDRGGGLLRSGERISTIERLANSYGNGCDKGRECITSTRNDGVIGNGTVSRLADASDGTEQRGIPRPIIGQLPQSAGAVQTKLITPGPVNCYWSNADWLSCRDGKLRPVESGTFPLVNGAPARVGRLRGYGNAIVAEVATQFIKAYSEGVE